MKHSILNLNRYALAISLLSLTFCAFAQSDNTTSKSAAELVKNSKEQIVNLTPQQVEEKLAEGNAVLVDLREAEELKKSGRISGSLHAPRGMLEFYADPSTPYHKPEFDKTKLLILYCASGGRSALGTTTLKEMGYENVAHLDGGIKAWKETGRAVIE